MAMLLPTSGVRALGAVQCALHALLPAIIEAVLLLLLERAQHIRCCTTTNLPHHIMYASPQAHVRAVLPYFLPWHLAQHTLQV
jgi:hypothetical protein